MMRRTLLITLAASFGLCAASCTENETSPPSSEVNQPTVRPFAFDEEPLWQDTTPQEAHTPRIAVRGESVLVFGNSATEPNRELLVRDAATGKARWLLDRFVVLPGPSGRRLALIREAAIVISGTGNDWTAYVPYLNDRDESGIAALRGVDGTERWNHAVRIDRPLSPVLHEVLAVDDRFVFTGTTSDDDRPHAFATEVATGRRLWDASGTWPQFVVGDTLLAHVGPRDVGGPTDPNPEPGATVVGLEALTGKPKWDLSARYPDTKVFMTLGGLAVLSQLPSGTSEYPVRFVIDARTGDTVAELGEGGQCVNDQERLIICAARKTGEFTVFDVVTRETDRFTVSGAANLQTAWRGYVTFDDGRVVDGSGALVTDDLPGSVLAMSEDYVVLHDRDSDQYAVHRR